MRAIFAIWKKDLKGALANLRLLTFLLAPILMSALFGSLFGGLRGGSAPMSLTAEPGAAIVVPVYDAGESQLVRLLHISEAYDARPVASPEEMEQLLLRDGLVAGVILPPGFDAALLEGQRPTLQLMINARHKEEGAALSAWLAGALWDRIGRPFPSVVTVETLSPQEISPLNRRQEQMALWLLMSLVTTSVYIVPALLIEEKQSRTLNAVLTTPASYKTMVLAKAGVGFVYSLLGGASILYLNGGFETNAAWVMGVVFLGSVVLVEMGLLLGSLLNDMIALNTWSTLIMLLLMLPGALHGLLTSGLFRLDSLQRVVRLLPTHYILEMICAALSDQIIAGRMGTDLALLIGLAILLFFLIVAVLRRREA